MIKHKDCKAEGCQSLIHHGHECHGECDVLLCQAKPVNGWPMFGGENLEPAKKLRPLSIWNCD